MTDQLLCETRITPSELARQQKVALPTVWRWFQRGIRGHILESFNVGQRRFTTREAFARWVSLTNGERVPTMTNRQVEASRRTARKELGAAGMLENAK